MINQFDFRGAFSGGVWLLIIHSIVVLVTTSILILGSKEAGDVARETLEVTEFFWDRTVVDLVAAPASIETIKFLVRQWGLDVPQAVNMIAGFLMLIIGGAIYFTGGFVSGAFWSRLRRGRIQTSKS